ncbi:MAG: fimbrillin family protein, partial [Oscillospiraceae bacterium]
LYMTSTIIDPSKDLVDGKLPITFKHLLSKVNISVTLGTELNTTPGTATNPISNLKVNGTKKSFRWSALNDTEFVFTGFPNAAITPFVGTYSAGSATTNAVANYEVILVPQTVAANEFSVTFTINNKEYTWTSAAAVTLERGRLYTLALTAGKDIVTLGSLSAKAWTAGTGGSIETE